MLIKSDFKDYYDCGKAYDFEQEPLYIRYSNHILIQPFTFPERKSTSPLKWMRWKSYMLYSDLILGFCGKVYFGHVKKFNPNKIDRVIYWEEGFDYGIEAMEFRESPRKFLDSFKQFFELYNTPIFSIMLKWHDFREDRTILTVNPNLSMLHFQTVRSPYYAYQDLRMYLSNKAAPEKPIPTISNEDMIAAKGFDIKSSFRKAKK